MAGLVSGRDKVLAQTTPSAQAVVVW